MFRSILLTLLALITAERLVNARIISTKQGRLEGLDQKARNGRSYTTFFGIPYAKSPIHDLRFAPPVPAGRWKGILNATKPTDQCPQVKHFQWTLHGDEDCLYVDVHVPEDIEAGDNVPVVVYFFGGGFAIGNTKREGTQFMMARDIVVVMVSYRLGVFGFLSTVDDVIPGNMGLKDQSEALRWTRTYIADYGGDPERVLIAGHSSGAACAHLHAYSPLSSGLFHRLVTLSGLGNAPHLFMDTDVARDLSDLLATGLNCSKESRLLLTCLRNKTVEEIMWVSENLRIWHQMPTAVFRPTIERSDSVAPFLTDYPHKHNYTSIEVPWMVGMTSQEGALYVNEYFGKLDGLDLRHTLMLPLYVMNLWTTKPSQLNYVSQLLQSHFFGEERLGPKTDASFAELLTGVMHGLSLIDVLEAYKGTKYVYLFNYKAAHSYQSVISNYRRYLGVGHGDELALLFKEAGTDGLFTSTDIDFGEELITRLVNFAYTGNPNEPFPLRTNMIAVWQQMQSERMEFLHIKMNGTMERDFFKEKFSFWRRLPIFSKIYDSGDGESPLR